MEKYLFKDLNNKVNIPWYDLKGALDYNQMSFRLKDKIWVIVISN